MYLIYYFCSKCYGNRINKKGYGRGGWWLKDAFNEPSPRCPIHHIKFRENPHDAEYKRRFKEYIEEI